MPFQIDRKNSPIKTAEGEITSLEFRDPTGDDFFALPAPMRQIMEKVEGSNAQRIEVIFDGPALRKWAIKLSGKGGDAISALSPREIAGFRDWLVPQLNADAGDDETNEKN
jgi:hypothetical protein